MTNEMIKSGFTDRLKQIIDDLGIEKKALAKQCGLSANQIHNYLNGSQEPATKFYRNLKNQYPSINLNWLICGDGTPSVKQIDSLNVIPMDPAVGLVVEVEKELGVKLNDRQRQAVVAVLRRELDRRISEQKTEITALISSFTMGESK